MLHVNPKILEIMRHRRASGQTPSVAGEITETQGEMTCPLNSMWSQNKDSGLWPSCLVTSV